jgi:hypothetical protein
LVLHGGGVFWQFAAVVLVAVFLQFFDLKADCGRCMVQPDRHIIKLNNKIRWSMHPFKGIPFLIA